jgi:peptidyl-prolyl cis-trans isomerase SurA
VADIKGGPDEPARLASAGHMPTTRRSSPFGLALTLLLLLPLPAAAQQAAAQNLKVDTLVRIVAIVGDSIITNLELQQALDLWEQEQPGRTLPAAGSDELEKLSLELLNRRIDALLLYQAAQRDTALKLTDEAVNAAVDRQVQTVVSQNFNNNQTALEQALLQSNLSMREYREMLATQIREQQLTQMYIGKVSRDRKLPPVSESEIREFFDQRTASQPMMVPPSVSFEQLVVPVRAGDSALAYARNRADSIRNAIVTEGADFATMARRFSQDPGTAELGGDVGWFRIGNMYRAFEQATYDPRMRPGDVTVPVLTPFGYHIIKLEKVRGPERQAKHILIRPTIEEADMERARALADTVAGKIRAGVSIDSLRRVHGDSEEPERLGPVVRDSLPEDYRTALEAAKAGDLIGPFGVELQSGLPRFAIVRVTRVEEARQANVSDYRQQIVENFLGPAKLRDEILTELRRSTYIEIRLGRSPPGR